MKTLEFESTLSAEGTLLVPSDVIGELKPRTPLKVVVIMNDHDDEEAAWDRLVAEQFFQKYAEEDSIYDDL